MDPVVHLEPWILNTRREPLTKGESSWKTNLVQKNMEKKFADFYKIDHFAHMEFWTPPAMLVWAETTLILKEKVENLWEFWTIWGNMHDIKADYPME